MRDAWHETGGRGGLVGEVLGARAADLDQFDRTQLEETLRVCRAPPSLSEAGRALFAAWSRRARSAAGWTQSVSRKNKSSTKDSALLRKYLAEFGLTRRDVSGRAADAARAAAPHRSRPNLAPHRSGAGSRTRKSSGPRQSRNGPVK